MLSRPPRLRSRSSPFFRASLILFSAEISLQTMGATEPAPTRATEATAHPIERVRPTLLPVMDLSLTSPDLALPD
eukprot:m.246650 g.246650  ORF g.246650 m.246650 type:complete len:75 (+) comp54472_c1_seq29:590-814(+)